MLNSQDILRTQFINKDFEITYITQERMFNWKKIWNKTFFSIDGVQLLEKISQNKIFSFYCTDTDPVLLWVGLTLRFGPQTSENKCFFIKKNNFLDFVDEIKFGKKKLIWLQEGF
jgi:hypothetical protein